MLPKSVLFRLTFFCFGIIGLILSMPLCLSYALNGQPVIAIDPGHGGSDAGASGLDTTREKDVVLALAKDLSHTLSPAYQVLLTRTDDYQIPLSNRAALANHANADLFISLHTAGSTRMQNRGAVIVCHKIQDPMEPPPLSEADEKLLWDRQQLPHLKKSRQFAALLQNQLDNLSFTGPTNFRQLSSPLLDGADMPAVLVEIIHLTNPEDRQLITSPDSRAQIVSAIRTAVDAFFSSSSAVIP